MKTYKFSCVETVFAVSGVSQETLPGGSPRGNPPHTCPPAKCSGGLLINVFFGGKVFIKTFNLCPFTRGGHFFGVKKWPEGRM